MNVRGLFTVLLTLAVLVSMAPVANAGPVGAFTPVDRPTPDMIDALLLKQVPIQADVFNGRFVARGDHPYVGLVLLIDPKTGVLQGQCSGTLITPRYVLTAGHCTKGARGAVFIPKVVDLYKVKPKDIFPVRAIATAPRYSARTLRDDVGLLKLSRPANIKSIPVAGAKDDVHNPGGTKATVVGWGAVDRRFKLPNRLRKGAIELLSNDRCHVRWGQAFQPRSMMCGGSKVTDTCVGDSGGPLLVRDKRGQWLLLGTTSFGRKPCSPTLDSVYARVSSVRPWIERVTGLAPRRT